MRKKLTLAGNFRNVFQRVFESKVPQGQSGWHLWQDVLGITAESTEFLQRLTVVRTGCLRLGVEVGGFSETDIDAWTKNLWAASISNLTPLTSPTSLHTNIETLKRTASKNDVATLSTLDLFYQQRGWLAQIEPDTIKSLVEGIVELERRIIASALDAGVKSFLLPRFAELRYFLDNIDLYGIDAVWSATSALTGTVVRFQEEFAKPENEEVGGAVVQKVKEVIEVLRYFGGAASGIAWLGYVTSALLGVIIPPAN